MTVYHPHHVDIDKRDVISGGRLTSGMYPRKLAPRDPCDTTVSTVDPHGSHEESA